MVHWVCMDIQILMQAVGIAFPPSKFIHRHKAPNGWIHIARPQVIESEMAVKELACIQVSILRDAAFVKQIPEGIVMVGVVTMPLSPA